MEKTDYKVKGLDELMKALKALPTDIKAKVLQSLLSKAGRKFIVVPLKQKLNYSANTEKSIKVITDSRDKLRVTAGVSSSGYKLRWADLGTKERTKGHNRGRIIGKKQIQPLIESQTKPIVDFISEEASDEINKALLRRLKRLRKR